MFLSIIIPIYNDEKYLKECLDSCLDQDIAAEDYEIVCVDDGSTDNTPQILRDYSNQHTNVRVITKPHGIQYGAGRNLGLTASEGEYVWFVDHDDFIESNILSSLKSFALSSGSERIAFNAYEFDEELSEEEQCLRKKRMLQSNTALLRDSVVWTSIIKRSFLSKNDIWPRSKRMTEQLRWSSDTVFLYELLRKGIQTSQFQEDRILYFYRRHSGSETTTITRESKLTKLAGKINVAKFIKQDFEEERKTNGKAQAITANHRVSWVRMCAFSLMQLDDSDYRSELRKFKSAHLLLNKIPRECTYDRKTCMRENRAMGVFRSFAFFYSPTKIGLRLFRLSFLKEIVKRRLSGSHAYKWIRKKLKGV